jgi:hypothetical protein
MEKIKEKLKAGRHKLPENAKVQRVVLYVPAGTIELCGGIEKVRQIAAAAILSKSVPNNIPKKV